MTYEKLTYDIPPYQEGNLQDFEFAIDNNFDVSLINDITFEVRNCKGGTIINKRLSQGQISLIGNTVTIPILPEDTTGNGGTHSYELDFINSEGQQFFTMGGKFVVMEEFKTGSVRSKCGNVIITVSIPKRRLFESAMDISALKGKYSDTYDNRLTEDESRWFNDELINACVRLYPTISAYMKNVKNPLGEEQKTNGHTTSTHVTWTLSMGNNYDENLSATIERNIEKVVVYSLLTKFYQMTKNALMEETALEAQSYLTELVNTLHMRKRTIHRGCSIF